MNKATEVYLLLNELDGLHKIGISCELENRRKGLTNANGDKPTVVSTVLFFNRVRAVSIEKFLHKTYDSKRKYGEWFDLSGADVADICFYFEMFTAAGVGECYGLDQINFWKAETQRLQTNNRQLEIIAYDYRLIWDTVDKYALRSARGAALLDMHKLSERVFAIFVRMGEIIDELRNTTD